MSKLDEIYFKDVYQRTAPAGVVYGINLENDAIYQVLKADIKQLFLDLINSSRWTPRDDVYTENRRQRDMVLDELAAKIEKL